MSKIRIAVLYGSRSPEHEVSVITAVQAMLNLNTEKYEIIPIYITKTGQWIKGSPSFLRPESYKNLNVLISPAKQLSLYPPETFTEPSLPFPKSLPKIDIAFPIFHGSNGEDGTIQGLLEMLNLPYVGCGVTASGLGMDKVLQKEVFQSVGLPQVKHVWIYKQEDFTDKVKGLKYPLYVKPANGGSSIGITKVKTKAELADAIEVALHYDRKVIIEESAEGYKEINISVLGNSGHELRTSVCEQPVAAHELLTFSDKYESNSSKSAGMASAKRLIPAPIKPITVAKITEFAKTAYQSLDCDGLARVDFLVSADEKVIYINEINTTPGSLAFYLWEASGIKFPQLLDRLIELGLQKHQEKSTIITTFNNNLLATMGDTLKGGKLGKL